MTVADCTITNNGAVGGTGTGGGGYAGNGGHGLGGGLYSIGSVTVTKTLVSDNTAVGGVGGGYRSQHGWGSGGGVWSSGRLALKNTTVKRNAADDGGGIRGDAFLGGGNSIDVTDSLILNNTAGGVGGGIRDTCSNTLNCSLMLVNSVISGNKAETGGGIWTSGASAGTVSTAEKNRCTISDNSAAWLGGG